MSKKKKGRELTDEEVKNLLLELKVCYMLCPWNTRAEITSMETWALEVGWLKDNIEDCEEIYDDEAYIKMAESALEDAENTLEYVKRFILLRDYDGKIWN